MATFGRIEKTPFLRYRSQRNFIVWIVFVGLLIVLMVSFLAIFVYPESNFFQALAFFILLIYSVGILYVRQVLMSVNMYYHYFRMIEENAPTIKAKRLPFSNQFNVLIESNGFKLATRNDKFSIYFQTKKRLDFVKRTGASIIWLIFIQDDQLNLHDQKIDEAIKDIKRFTLKGSLPTNELSFIFKEVLEWPSQHKDAFQEIINFSSHNRAIISIPCAVISPKQTIYALRPIKEYPNKFYYSAIMTLYHLIDAKEAKDGRRN